MVTKEEIFEILSENISTTVVFADAESVDNYAQFEGDEIDVEAIIDYTRENMEEHIYEEEYFMYFSDAWKYLQEADNTGKFMFEVISEYGEIPKNFYITNAANMVAEREDLDQLYKDLETCEELLEELNVEE